MVYEWGTTRRFNAYADYFKSVFGERVQKLTINAGFTCPNRDGKAGRGGCTFCDNRAFNPSYNDPHKPVRQQLDEGIAFHKIRYRRVRKYLAYFQAYSNTYAPLEDLKRIYQPALDHPQVVGLVIGTRPDCVDEEKLDYFAELARDHYLVMEYGIESVKDEVLKAVNRGHDFSVSRWVVEETAKRGIHTGGHMIIGLPGETEDDWYEAASILSALPFHNLKFHQLQLIKGTAMARQYQEDPSSFRFMEVDEYLDIMVRLVERIRPGIVIERIAGEVNPGTALQTGWGLRYDQVLNIFEKLLEERDTYQGKYYSENT